METKKEKSYTFKKINSFNTPLIENLYEIIKNNMIKIGFEINDKSKDVWINNINKMLLNNNFYLYVIKFNNEVCGFIELIDSNSILIVSEIQLSDKVKGSYLILHILKFLVNNENFKQYNKIRFSINNNNLLSLKTFKHLGAKLCEQRQNNSTYEIERQQIENYLNNLKITKN